MPSTTTSKQSESAAQPCTKPSKRKGTRSVSTLTPAQLARKRANDRQAQRTMRARNKEHIERLEHELEELRSHQSGDRTVKDLLRRNKALKDEVSRLREAMGMSMASSPYSALAPYDGQQQHAPGTVSSPRESPRAAVPDDNPLLNPEQHHAPISGSRVRCWVANVAFGNDGNVSSPSSPANDYVPGNSTTSVPTSMMYVFNGLEPHRDSRRNGGPMQPTVYPQQQYSDQPCQQNPPPGDWPMPLVDYNSQIMGGEPCVCQ